MLRRIVCRGVRDREAENSLFRSNVQMFSFFVFRTLFEPKSSSYSGTSCVAVLGILDCFCVCSSFLDRIHRERMHAQVFSSICLSQLLPERWKIVARAVRPVAAGPDVGGRGPLRRSQMQHGRD